MGSRFSRLVIDCTVFTCLTTAFTLQLAAAEFSSSHESGELQGTVYGSSQLPSLGASIQITTPESSTAARETVSNGDGSFTIDHLAPGHYQLQAYAANGDLSLPIAVIVSGPETVHLDIPMQQTNPSSPSPVSPASPSAGQRGFFARWGHAYIDDWTASSSGAAPALSRSGEVILRRSAARHSLLQTGRSVALP